MNVELAELSMFFPWLGRKAMWVFQLKEWMLVHCYREIDVGGQCEVLGQNWVSRKVLNWLSRLTLKSWDSLQFFT